MAIRMAFLVFFSALSAFSQAGRLDSGHVNGPNFALYWETRLEPASPALVQNLGTATIEAKIPGPSRVDLGLGQRLPQKLVCDRIWMDRSRRTYFGYNVSVTESQGTYSFRFIHLALTPELARAVRIDDPESWTQLAIGRPEPATVRSGEIIALDLMVNPDTGQKIVDYISIQEPFQPTFNNPTPRQFSYVGGPPRDFRVEDAELHIREPRLNVNGKMEASSEDVIGAMVWLYAPNKGRFLLSLTPRPGFQKAGEVRGVWLTFNVGPDRFTLSSAVRIAPGDAPFNLYVSPEPAWRPQFDTFQMGAAPAGQVR